MPGSCPRDYVMSAQRIMSGQGWRAGRRLARITAIKLGILTSLRLALLLMHNLHDVIPWTRSGYGRQHAREGRRQARRAGGITDAEQRSAEGDRPGVHPRRFLRSRRPAAGEVRDGA